MSKKEVNPLEAIEQGNLNELKAFLQKNPQFLNSPHPSRINDVHLLTWALLNHQNDIFYALLEMGADATVIITRTHGSPSSPLATAMSYEDKNAVKALVEHGADFASYRTSAGQGIFTEMLILENIALLDLIISLGFDVALQENASGKSLICQALESGGRAASGKMILALLDRGANIDGAPGSRPLVRLFECQKFELVETFVDRGADISYLSNNDLPLLHYLIDRSQHFSKDIPKSLLIKLIPADYDFTQFNYDACNAFHYAAIFGQNECIDYMVSNGVGINSRVLRNSYQKGGETALLLAIQNRHIDTVLKLIDLGVDLNIPNGENKTALDLARKVPGFKKVIDALEKGGAYTYEVINSNKTEDEISIIKGSMDLGEPWSDAALIDIESQDADNRKAWADLIRHCLDNSSSKPSKRWLKIGYEKVDVITKELFREKLLKWLPMVKEKRTSSSVIVEDGRYEYGGWEYYISEGNTRILKGLVWLTSQYDDAEMTNVLRNLAISMYKKIYGIGMRNSKIANAALISLAAMEGDTGLKEIAILRSSTKYNPALTNINRVFDKIAKDRDISPDELAQISIPDYGLTEVGSYCEKLGEYEAVIRLTHIGKTEFTWTKDDGKVQKSIPASVKRDFADDVTRLKSLVKDLQVATSAHSQRVEQMFLSKKTLDLETWMERYIDHPVIGFIGRRLIWRLTGDTVQDVIYSEEGFIGSDGKAVHLPNKALVSLWHPAISTVKGIENWRNTLMGYSITQPFKQAHREIYILTDAEKNTSDHSLRFSSHILKQHLFHALATRRGWSQTRGGPWDGGDETSAYKAIKSHGVFVEFVTEYMRDYEEVVSTQEVCFTKKNHNSDRIPLESIDPLVFSEVMRDVDLFVGVGSVGNDPEWDDRESNSYWQTYSFGELSQYSETRKSVLEKMIPTLKIAPKLHIEGKYLIVNGDIRTYKIHIGSSNILMEPGNQYLCIVAKKSTSADKLYIPFEGDAGLSAVLSKAVMLANDKKIKDKTIISQIYHIKRED